MYVVFPDGSRLALKPDADASTTRPGTVWGAEAAIVADVRGGRIDHGPATLRQAIIGHAECAAAAARLAAAWLETGQLDFHGRAAGPSPGPLAIFHPRAPTEFFARARLTPAGTAILRDAISSTANSRTSNPPPPQSLPNSDLLTSNPASLDDLRERFRPQ